MATQASALKMSTRPNRESAATCFGLTVEVIERMEHCSLVRYQGREFVVATEDLRDCQAMDPAR
jgi:hypothetical protein